MEPKFSLKKILHEEKVGQILAKARQKRGFSIHEIEKKTKIRAKYLLALEEGSYEKLPADVYVKGFLQGYCQILDLDDKAILALYQRERNIQKSLKQINEPPGPKPIKSPSIIITPKTLIIIGLALAFILTLGYIWYQFSAFTSAPKLTVEYPPDNLKVKESSITIEGKTDPEAQLYINDQAITFNPDGTFKSTFTLQEGINIIKILAKNAMGNATTLQRQVLAEFEKKEIASPPPPKETNEKTKNLELLLKIGPNSAWIYIEVDDKVAYEGTMLAGTSRSFKAKEKIVLTTGNAGSTEVIFNGQSLGKLGNEGEVKRGIRFDKNTQIEKTSFHLLKILI